MSTINAVASSSKRPAPPSTPSQSLSHSAKRARPSTDSQDNDLDASFDDDEGELEHGVETAGAGPLDDSAAAKAARKEARTIRNRESAQRSRNQRKAHLAYLETRVVELEAENRALKGLPPSSTDDSSSRASTTPPSIGVGRETSPAQSVMSLANDLGIPPELVNAGVNLANVAPPPADVMEDIKPTIGSPALTAMNEISSGSSLATLTAENAALKERVSLLESLVKQVVAVANLSGINTSSTPVIPSESSVPVEQSAPIDWSAFLSAAAEPYPAPGLDATLTPSYSSIPAQSAFTAQPSTSFTTAMSSEHVSNPVARHPAAGEGESFDIVFGNGNGFGQGQAEVGSGSEIVVGFGATQGLDNASTGTQAFDPFTMYGMDGQTEVDFSGAGNIDWTSANGQVQREVENWDEAMRSLIDSIEGGEQQEGQMYNALEVQLFGQGSVMV